LRKTQPLAEAVVQLRRYAFALGFL
jgi:hypothetical protein